MRPLPARVQPGDEVIGGQALVLPEVCEGGESDLGVVDVLPLHLPPEVIGDQSEISGRAQQVLQGEVDVDEVAEVGEAIPLPQPGLISGGQGQVVPPGQLQDGGRQDRSFQVHMQLDLGQSRSEVVKGGGHGIGGGGKLVNW